MNFGDMLDYYLLQKRLQAQGLAPKEPITNPTQLIGQYQQNIPAVLNTPVPTPTPSVVPKLAQPVKQVDPITQAIRTSATKYGVDPLLVREVIRQESGFNPKARNKRSGAAGLMQFMPATAKSLGLKNPYDPIASIDAGAKYLSQLSKQFGGDVNKTLAAYNAGPGNVRKYGGVPPFKETKNYVNQITGKMAKYNAAQTAKQGNTKGIATVTPVQESWGGNTPLKGGFKFNRTLPSNKFNDNECGKYVREVLKTYGWQGKKTGDLKNSKYGTSVSGNDIGPGTVVHLKRVAPKTSKGYSTNHYALVYQGNDGGLYLNELVTGKNGGHRVKTSRTLASQAHRIDNAWRPKGLNAQIAANPNKPQKGKPFVPGIDEWGRQQQTEQEAFGRAVNKQNQNILAPVRAFGESTQVASQNFYKGAGKVSQRMAREDAQQARIAKNMTKSHGMPIPRNTQEAMALLQNSGIDAMVAGVGGRGVKFASRAARKAAKNKAIAVANMASKRAKKIPLVAPKQVIMNFARQEAKQPGSATRFMQGLTDIANIPRTLMTTGDLSAAGRQGAALWSEGSWWKSWPKSLRSAVSKSYFEQMNTDMQAMPTYKAAKQAGLYLAESGEKATLVNAEEGYLARTLQKIPGLKHVVQGSERAYTGFLNPLRMGTFDKYAQLWGNTANKNDYTALARFINDATGRGTLGSLEHSAPALSSVFFSPRFVMSRLQLPLSLASKSPKVRQVAMKNLAAFAGAGMSAAALLKHAAGADIDLNPTSSDFGKARIGNTRFDFFAGYAPLVRYGAQIALGKTTDPETGKTKQANRLDTVGRFVRSKLAPGTGMAVNALAGKDFIGNEVNLTPGSVKQQAGNLLVPMSIQDAMDAYNKSNKYGVSKSPLIGAIAGATSTVGIGTQTYDKFSKLNIQTQQGKNYWNSRLAKARYLNTSVGNNTPRTPKSTVLWELKNAMVDNDVKTAKQKYLQYIALGGNRSGLNRSLDNADPMKDIPLEKIPAFLKSLKPEEKKAVLSSIVSWEVQRAILESEIDKYE